MVPVRPFSPPINSKPKPLLSRRPLRVLLAKRFRFSINKAQVIK
jgi:hypothetical protein